MRLLRKALFLVRTLKPKVLALLNQANSPSGCMRPGFRLEKCASLIHAYRAATPPCAAAVGPFNGESRRHFPISALPYFARIRKMYMLWLYWLALGCKQQFACHVIYEV